MRYSNKILVMGLVMALVLMSASTAVASVAPRTEERAAALYQLDLFLGMDPDAYVPHLEGATDRAAAMTMIARALDWPQSPDWDDEAVSGFADVPIWAEPYVAYAVQRGVTVGIGDNLFGNDMPVTERQIQTWFERALGFGDTWEDNVSLDNSTPLIRADLVDTTWDALMDVPAGEVDTLIEIMLAEEGQRYSIAAAAGLIKTHYLPGEILGDTVPTGPNVMEGTLFIEGMEEATTYFRHHLEALHMVTYVPEHIEVTTAQDGGTDVVSMYTAFGGIHREDVHLTLTLHDATEDLEQIVAAGLEAGGYTLTRIHGIGRAHPWAKLEMAIEYVSDTEHYVGRLAFGQRGDRVLSVMTHMPIEFAEGAQPRFRAILDGAQWYFPGE